jgi:hypothetical protein
MKKVVPTLGNLQQRIASGQADPISDYERARLEEIRQIYIRRFGEDPAASSSRADELKSV